MLLILFIIIVIFLIFMPVIALNFIGLFMAIIYIMGIIGALPFAIYSEKDYDKRSFFRPIKHSILYSWVYVYTFFSKE